jgi:predicted DCC family thiol-disulfide oxidoreductase YuxK
MSSDASTSNASTANAPPADAPSIIVFDGVCHLCNGWVRFLLRQDRHARFRFASMQSDAGRGLLAAHGIDPEDPGSFLLLEAGIARTDSDAILRVLASLGWPWRAATVFRLVPAAWRDPAYRWIARNRYRLFGRRDVCAIPSPESAARFLD